MQPEGCVELVHDVGGEVAQRAAEAVDRDGADLLGLGGGTASNRKLGINRCRRRGRSRPEDDGQVAASSAVSTSPGGGAGGGVAGARMGRAPSAAEATAAKIITKKICG